MSQDALIACLKSMEEESRVLNLKKWLDTNTSHETDIIDMKGWTLPPVQSVFVSVDRTPDEFKPLAERVFKAAAFTDTIFSDNHRNSEIKL